jgi:uncharacterized protein YbcI
VVECLRAFRHVGFFALKENSALIWQCLNFGARIMNDIESVMAQEIAQIAIAYQTERTGHAPASVSVMLSQETLVITLHDALTPAEKALALSPTGAAQVQEFHRQLFLSSAGSLRKEITRITGREVREAAAEIEPATGAVVHAFMTGNLVQVFRLDGRAATGAASANVGIIPHHIGGDE